MDKPLIQVLLIEDNPGDAVLLREALAGDPTVSFQLTLAERLSEGLGRLQEQRFDVVLLDLGLPDSQGLATFDRLHRQAPEMPTLVLSGLLDEQTAVEAVQAGAQDYLVKGQAGRDSLVRAIRYAIERQQYRTALQASEQRFRALIEYSADASSLLTIDGTIFYESPAAMRILGYRLEELVDHSAFEFLHPDDYDTSARLFGQVLQQPRTPVMSHIRFRRKDDTWCWMEATATNLLDEPGVQAIVINFRDITERKRAETAIREMAENMAEAQRIAHLGSWQMDLSESLESLQSIQWSDECYRIFGFEPGSVEITAEFINSRAHPDDREPALQAFLKSIQDRTDYSYEFRIVLPDGTIRYVHDQARVVVDERSSQPIKVVGTIHDITERKRTEEALRESEERFRTLYENSTIGIYRTTPDGRILLANPTLVRLLGLSSFDELATRNLEQDGFEPSYDRAQFLDLIEREGEVSGLESRWARRDGTVIFVRESAHAIRDPQGRTLYYDGTVEDITERKRAEEAQRESEERYRLLFENAPVGIFSATLQGQIIEVNPMALQILGSPSVEATRAINLLTFPPLVEAGFSADFQHCLETGQPVFAERPYTSRWGKPIHTQYRLRPIPNAAGQIVLVQTIIEDITERKQMEAALRDQVAALQTLTEIDREIMAATGQQSILDLVCRRAAELMHAQKSAIATKTSSDRFEMTASFGLRDPERASLEFARQWQTGSIRPAGLNTRGATALNSIPAEAPHTPEFRARENIQSLALAQLVAGQDLLGVLMVYDSAPREWNADELRLLSLLAGQAAIAFEKTRLYEMARNRAVHLETLNTIGQAITSTLDLDRVLATLLETVARATDVEACSVALVEADTGDLVFQQAAGQAGWVVVGMRLKPGQGVAGWVAAQRQPAVILDAASDPRFYEQIDGATGFVTRTIVCVPMLVHESVIGVIELVNKQTGTFGKDDVQLLESVAAQATIAIENARLFETERSARQRLEILYGVGQVINSSLDAEAILDRLTDEAMRATHATHGSGIIARLDLDRFDRRSLRGYTPEQAERARHLFLPLDQGLNGRAYRTQQTVYLPDVRTDPDYFALIPETLSELVVPILRSGQVLANLDLQSPKVDAFRDVDTEFLHALIDQVAIALENARLFEETRRRLDEMAVVSQVALIGAAGRPFDETVSRATDGLARLWPDAVLGFLFVDEADQSLHLHHSYHGVSPEMLANLRIPLDQGLVGWAMREQQPVRMGNAAADSRYIAFVEGTLSKMVAPLMVGGRVIGTINVECPWPNAYSGDDLRVLMALASQLATIFEKARLDAALAEHAATLEQRVAERTAELRQAEAKYRTLVEQTPAVTYTAALDENHSLLYISPQIEALTGLAPAAWLAEPGLRFKRLHPDDRQRVLDELARAIDCNSAFRSEYRLLAQEGRVVWVRDEGRLVCDEGGRPICVQGILLDVTERKQAEEEIRRALEKEKELNELKSRFVSMASHEFRTPLTGILSSAELLQEYGARWTEERKLVHLRRIQASVQHMTSLLNDVLVIGKADAGKLEFKPAPLDLVKLCRELVEEMQLSAGAKHTLTFASQVKSAPASMDENLLRHIVSNLLSNAIKYSPQGGEVQCTLTCQADQAILQVKDQGIGIPLEDQAHLFETFHRASNIRNIPGTGLGLAIVKRSVDAHGGTINVSSQVGVGTTVTVTLPLGVSNGE